MIKNVLPKEAFELYNREEARQDRGHNRFLQEDEDRMVIVSNDLSYLHALKAQQPTQRDIENTYLLDTDGQMHELEALISMNEETHYELMNFPYNLNKDDVYLQDSVRYGVFLEVVK